MATASINYYGPLLTRHVKTILECGLLLDEDYEVLLNASNFKMYPLEPVPVPYGLITGGLATLAGVFLARRYGQPMVVLPPLAATLVLLCLKRKSILKRGRHEDIVKDVVKSFVRLHKLNASIIRYVKMRNSAKQKDDSLLVCDDNVRDFLRYFAEQNRRFFSTVLKEISFLVDLSEDLKEDFRGVKAINIESILTLDDDNYEPLTTRVQDVNTFFSSKYLNYLGLSLCKNFRNINANELEILLDKKLSSARATVDELAASVQKEFNNLRYCTSKKLQIDTRSWASLPGKLQQTLIGAINNLSIIMEKSRAVLEKVNRDMDDEKDVAKIESALADLRDHAHATYESLDVLCKLYGILSSAQKCRSDNAPQKGLPCRDTESDRATTVNYDDTSEAVEENYELYIPEGEDTFQPKESYEDQTGTYLSLMLKELKQSLKQHERFIAARSKRGVDDDNDDVHQEVVSRKVPKFDLKAIEKELLPVPAPRASKLPLLAPPTPPPPPPPPPLRVADDVVISAPSRTLLENVRNLSSQLQGGEDVFGDECSSDSD